MTPDPINCYRCGRPGRTEWADVSSLGDLPGSRWIEKGEQYCLTEGCADEDGSRRLVALTPAELRARADAAWFRRHKVMVEDR